MVIIGIVGSTPQRRQAVAERAASAEQARLLVHAMLAPNPHGVSAPRSRSKRVAAMVEDSRGHVDGVIFSHLLTLDEAERLRDLGGVVWHVEGTPSGEIPIERHDWLVTDVRGGERHFLDPIEALSETLLHYARAAA